MKKLIVSIAVICAIVIGLDRLLAHVMWQVNQQSHDIWSYKIKYLYNDANQDIILFGTSRCNNHYVSSIIADSMNMSVYNGGISSSRNIFAHYIALNLVLIHHTPKIVCLELSSNDFNKESDAFSSTNVFAPYINKAPEIDSVFHAAGSYWPFMLSHLYRFNNKACENMAGLVLDWEKDDASGYQPIGKPEFLPDRLEHELNDKETDNLKLDYLQRFIDKCNSRNIKLVFMISPRYTMVSSTYYNDLKLIANRNRVPLLDYHTAGLYLNSPELFKDPNHLWDEGARLYSSFFATDLMKIMN
ncbi:MAG: hypothetical protein K6F94_04225 [Bacteroidaceae bacterium]|nr:hypothetical protein [Bacteroidaceae bacterium]